jgi:hypothetical protein
MIPGLFIIDFLRRGSAIRQYTKHFMFPRKLAMNAARAIIEGQNPESIDSDQKDHIRIWLESLKLYSPDLAQAHAVLIDTLAAHYVKLLNAEGETFNILIEHAYQNRENFKNCIETLASAENEVDRLVIDQMGGNEKVKEKILAEQHQIALRRQKILEDVF